MASLVACELSTARILTRTGNFKIINANFKSASSGYDVGHFKEGGRNNHIEDVNIVAEFQTNGTQADLDELHKKVKNSCPVYQTFLAAGININNQWKNIEVK